MAMLRSLAIKTLACWGILTILFCGLLVAAYAIPVSLVERNAVSSALTNVSDESAFGVGADPSRWASTPTVWVMLSMATHDDGGLLESAMAGAYYESEEGISDIGIGERANRTYEWYWHGWLVVLKPLLVFFDYAAIKKVFAVVCVGLLVALCVSADRKLPRGGYCLAVVASFALTSTFSAVEVLPFFFSVCIALLGSLVALRFAASGDERSLGSMLLSFFILGALTTYFDFLVTPALTLLLPLAWFFLARVELGERVRTRALLVTGVALAAFWCLGYGLLWLSKWALASLMLGINVFDLGINQFLFRSGAEGYADNRTAVVASEWDGVKVAPYEAIRLNVAAVSPGFPESAFAVASALAMVGCALFGAKRKGAALSLCLGVVWLAPYAWHAVLSNHSIIHYYFTCRLQAASPFAFFVLSVHMAQGSEGEVRAWRR